MDDWMVRIGKTLWKKHEMMNEAIYSSGDLRSRDMLFMRRFDGVVILLLAYLLVSILGPRIMSRFKPFDLKWIMFVYNVSIAVWSLWMFLEMFINSRIAGYNYLCDPYRLSYEPSELRIVDAMWWYFVSKAVEFLDTVFMVLKNKNSQITFLHVYHHVFMFPFLYFAVLLGPCCQALIGPIMNTFVHVVMYAYYALSLFPALQKYLWWKRYLTQLQLVQFFVLLGTTVYGLTTGCEYPRVIAYLQLIFISSLVILFTNFYVQAYIRRHRKSATLCSKETPTERYVTPVKNGHSHEDIPKKLL